MHGSEAVVLNLWELSGNCRLHANFEKKKKKKKKKNKKKKKKARG